MARYSFFGLLLYFVLLACQSSAQMNDERINNGSSGQPVLVAAASSIRSPLDIIINRFGRHNGIDVNISYGSSGNLTHQSMRGAPYHILMAANSEYPQRLKDAGLVSQGPVEYARGKLVLYVPEHSRLTSSADLTDVANLLTSDRLRHLAIANPQLAPYGVAARQVLQHNDLWESIKSRLVRGNNVAQAAQFTLTGDVDAGLIAESLALDPGLRKRGHYNPIEQRLYRPIRHTMVLLDGNHGDAMRLFKFLASPEAVGVFNQHGL